MTAAAGPLERLAAHLASAMAPLTESVSSLERFRGLMLRLGWDVTSLPPAYTDLGQDVLALAAHARELIDEPSAGLALEVLDGVAGAYEAMAALPAPEGVDRGQFTAEIGERLFELLLGDHLARELPVTMALLEVLGLAVLEGRPAAGGRPSFARLRLAWDELPEVLADPTARVLSRYRWGEADFEPMAVLEEVLPVLAGWGILVGLGPPDPTAAAGYLAGEAEGSPSIDRALQVVVASAAHGDERTPVGFDLLGLPGSDGEPPGLLLQPNLPRGIGTGFPLTDAWEVQVDGVTDPAIPVGLVVRPGSLTVRGAFEPDGGLPPGGLGLTLASSGTDPAVLLGSADASRLEVGATSVALTLTDDGQPQLAAIVDLDDVALVVSIADLGSFLASLTGGAELRVSFGFGFTWTSGAGLSIAAEGGFEVTLQPALALGPVTVDVIELAIRGVTSPAPVISAEARVGVTGSLPPVTFAVDRVGIALVLELADGNAGPAGVALSFLPPARIGLTIDGGVVSGGGFLEIDTENGRYAGGLALDLFGFGLSAIVIVDTELPGDPDGWALFGSLGLEFLTPIPLGFGFTLIGVGGLLALNRTLDIDGLAADLRTGAADSILFPDDLEEDAYAVLAGLDTWFPIMDGSTVFGPVVQIGWGSPTIVTAQLGVVVALPDLIVALLGSVEVLLPTPDAPVLSLRMDVLGAVDVPAGTVIVAASLHDSNLLGVFELSGDMGFYLALLGQPLFVLSVGGYHAQFDPPGALPAWLLDLRRTRAAIELGENVEVVLTSYVAVTSNTLQFGGKFRLEASVEVLLTTYSAEGWFSINVLLVLKPFKLVARATAGVSISAGDKELLGVDLSARLEGPEPWYATGHATFTFFGFDVDLGFEIGDQAGGEPREIHDVATDVVTALEAPGAWQPAEPGDAWASGVVMSDERPEGLWVRPDQLVELLQSVAPLNRTMTAFGEFTPALGLIEAEDVTLAGDAVAAPEWIDDWFAPAQFDRLDDGERLSGPSYELMTAGVRFGDDGIGITADLAAECASVSRAPEESIFPDHEPPPSGHVCTARPAALAGTTRSLANDRIQLKTTTYTVVRVADGLRADVVLGKAGAGPALAYAEACAVLAGQPVAERSRLRVAPSHAARERVAA